jgi:hypothetical protein
MLFAAMHESVIGTKLTSPMSAIMSVVGGIADIEVNGIRCSVAIGGKADFAQS